MEESVYNQTFKNRAEINIGGQAWADLTEEFGTELAETAPHVNLGDKTPRFTEPHGGYLYARLRAVYRHCKDWPNLRTVWLSLTADEKRSGKWVHPLKHDDGFRSSAVKQAVYRARRALDVKQWAGLWLMAPRKTGYSHKHYALLLDVDASVREIESAFSKVVKSHTRAHPYASEKGNPCTQAVQAREGDGCKKLLPEIGHNIPELGPEVDIRNIGEDRQYARIWAALYWHQDRIRQYELGRFSEIADDARDENLPSGDWEYGTGWKE